MCKPGISLVLDSNIVNIDLTRIKTKDDILNVCKAIDLKIEITKNTCSPELLETIKHLFTE